MPPRTTRIISLKMGVIQFWQANYVKQSLTSKLRTGQNCSKHEPYPEKTVADSNVTLPM